jgi:hypothetical protein
MSHKLKKQIALGFSYNTIYILKKVLSMLATFMGNTVHIVQVDGGAAAAEV